MTLKKPRRLLGLYSGDWREEHEPVLRGMIDDRLDDGGSIRSERRALLVESHAQRLRYPTPFVLSLVAFLVSLAGLEVTAFRIFPAGQILWLGVAPLLLAISAATVVAVWRGGWSPRVLIGTIAAIVGVGAFSASMMIGFMRSEAYPLVPDLASMWKLGVVSIAMAGIVGAMWLDEALSDGGIRQPWAALLGFLAGAAGAPVLWCLMILPFGGSLLATGVIVATLRVRTTQRIAVTR